MAHGAHHLARAAHRIWQADGLVVRVAVELRSSATGNWVQSRHCLPLMDRRRVDPLSTLSLVRWREAKKKGLVVVIFVSMVSRKGPQRRKEIQDLCGFASAFAPLREMSLKSRHAKQRNPFGQPSGWRAHTRKLSIRGR